ncbi:hypothetical protein [Cupriavidus campinensis]|uniref:DUF4189 domain-containing protein n=1 Tax=Cupriavidus campinensis TaxID=151783 RepID=A0ABY3ESU5_9BURK|nr:hypothetical protein [Cupriavidus campinensis]TSP14050.1 hypothetical protein FGG12_06155 [Cupriavidus campinensis]
MHWILIAIFAISNGRGATDYGVAMQEFNTQAACIEASKAVIEAKGQASSGYSMGGAYRCVPKG